MKARSEASYGIDAPPVIIVFGLLAAGSWIIASLLSAFLSERLPTLIATLSWVLGLITLYCLINALSMVASSLWGKPRLIRRVLDTLSLQKDAQALDLGCGRGLVTTALAHHLPDGKVFGLDIWNSRDQSRNSLAATQANLKAEGLTERTELVTADMRDIPFPNDSFDVITACLSIHNLPSPEDRTKALEEAVRVLKPDGVMTLIDFQHTDAYRETLEGLGLKVEQSKRSFWMFPPVRVVTAYKR